MSFAFLWETKMLDHAPRKWLATRGVLQALRTFMKNETGQAFPSIQTLAKTSGRSPKTVIKATKVAEGIWLRITRRPGQVSHYQAIIPPEVQRTLSARELKRIPKELRCDLTPPESLPGATTPREADQSNSIKNSSENSGDGQGAPPPLEREERPLPPGPTGEELEIGRWLLNQLSRTEHEALKELYPQKLRFDYALSPFDLLEFPHEVLEPLFDKYRDEPGDAAAATPGPPPDEEA